MTTPNHLFRSANLRIFPEAFPLGKNPDRTTAAKGKSVVRLFSSSMTAITIRARRGPSCAIVKPMTGAHNFAFRNSIQRKFHRSISKEFSTGWQEKTARQLPNYISHRCSNFSKSLPPQRADFCLEIYRSDGLARYYSCRAFECPGFRQAACHVPEFLSTFRRR